MIRAAGDRDGLADGFGKEKCLLFFAAIDAEPLDMLLGQLRAGGFAELKPVQDQGLHHQLGIARVASAFEFKFGQELLVEPPPSWLRLTFRW